MRGVSRTIRSGRADADESRSGTFALRCVIRSALRVALASGTVLSVWAGESLAQDAAKPNQPGNVPVLLGANPVVARRANPDESVVGRDALVRVGELSKSGNTSEALRVLQQTLETEGDLLLASALDPNLFIPVRRVVHAILRADSSLFERYRETMEPAAREALKAGQIDRVERDYFVTSAGLVATLDVAERELRAGRFESARLRLSDAGEHPDLVGSGETAKPFIARRVALAVETARYLVGQEPARRAELQAWCEAMRGEGKSGAEALKDVFEPPRLARQIGTDTLGANPSIDPATVAAEPIQTVKLGGQGVPLEGEDLEPLVDENGIGIDPIPGASGSGGAMPWVMPASADGMVFVNDGQTLRAFDSVTLSEMWSSPIDPTDVTLRSRRRRGNDFGQFNSGIGQRYGPDDAATVSVRGGVAVAVGGYPTNGDRSGDGRVRAFGVADGQELWAVDVRELDQRLLGGSVRGNVVIDGDTAVVAVRRPGVFRRITALYLVGLDLFTGEMKWLRQVGNAGTQMWGRISERSEGSVLYRGVVYRGDEMGVFGAYEAQTGRPRWVRVSANVPKQENMWGFVNGSESEPPATMVMPVVTPAEPSDESGGAGRGPEIVYLESMAGGLQRFNAETGGLLSRFSGDKVADAQYVVRIGDRLALPGRSGIAFLRTRFSFSDAPELIAYPKDMATGRCTAIGDELAVPMAGTVVLIDPKDPAKRREVPIERSGNLVVSVDGSGDGARLLSVDRSGISAFVTWEQASRSLDARIAANPRDPRPLLTYAELAARTGRLALLPDLSDRVFGVVAGGEETQSRDARQRLYAILIDAVRNGRRAMMVGTSGAARSDAKSPSLGTIAELSAVEVRLRRAAVTPAQIASVVLERAAIAVLAGEDRSAVEALQEVLLDTTLTALPVDAVSEERDRVGTLALGAGVNLEPSSTAGGEAAARLWALLQKTGPSVYVAFDEEAQRELDALPASASSSRLIALAAKYPCAAATPRIYRLASERAAGAKQADPTMSNEARLYAGLGLRALRMGAGVGRPLSANTTGGDALLGDLVALLVRTAPSGDDETSYRLLAQLTLEAPTTGVSIDGKVMPIADAAAALRARVVEQSNRAQVGTKLGPGVQLIEGWQPVDALVSVNTPTAVSGASLAMTNERTGEIALWARTAEDGKLRPLWVRSMVAGGDATVELTDASNRPASPETMRDPAASRPSVLRIGVDDTLLFWPAASGGTVEAVSNIDGRTLWRTPNFNALLGAPPAQRVVGANGDNTVELVTRVMTPLDGPVRADDLLLAVSNDALVLVERRGRAAAFGLRDGGLLWKRQLEHDRVFEVEMTEAGLVVGGAGGRGGEANENAGARPTPFVAMYDLGGGAMKGRVPASAIADHPRWIRACPGEGAGQTARDPGAVVMATSAGVVKYSFTKTRVEWSVNPPKQDEDDDRAGIASSMSGWVVGSGVFALDADLGLWHIDLDTGKLSPKPLETRGKITVPMEVTIERSGVDTRATLSIATGLGSITFDDRAQLVGCDAVIDADRVGRSLLGGTELPAVGHQVVFIMEPTTALPRNVNANQGFGAVQQFDEDEPQPVRVVSVERATGRALADRTVMLYPGPREMRVVDGKLLITQADLTTVIDAGVSPK